MQRATPRKQPRQGRSRAMVDAMLEAAARILVTGGYAALNTNKVAEVAGVSVGSVYQYFPNKQALVGALRERHAAEVNRVVGGAASQAAGQDIEAVARRLVRASVEAHLIDRDLHRVLTVEIPDVGHMDGGADPNRPGPGTVYSSLLPLVTQFGPGLPAARIEQIACIGCEIVEALVHAAVVEGRLALASDALEDEIVRVLLGYVSALRASESAGSARG